MYVARSILILNPYFKFITIITAALESQSLESDEMVDLEFLGYCITCVYVVVTSILLTIAYKKDRRMRKNLRKNKE